MRGRRSTEVRQREAFGPWLVARGLTGLAIEVGVHQGEFAAAFMAGWPGRYLGVDPWRVLAEYQDDLNWAGKTRSDCQSQADRDRDLEITRAAMASFGDRVELMRELSADGALKVADGIADFIYIDARHEYDSIREDLELWWPKLRPGGVLAGHDYAGCWAGTVGKAVDEFAEAHGLDVWTVPGAMASWYLLPAG